MCFLYFSCTLDSGFSIPRLFANRFRLHPQGSALFSGTGPVFHPIARTRVSRIYSDGRQPASAWNARRNVRIFV